MVQFPQVVCATLCSHTVSTLSCMDGHTHTHR